MVRRRADLEIYGARTVRWSRLALTRFEKGVGMRREGSRVPTGRHTHLSRAVEAELGQNWTKGGQDESEAVSP
jgi:hypothetical protein